MSQNSIANKRVVMQNIATTILQIIINGLVYYWLYKFLVLKLGIEQLGIMSLILAISSVASISNMGLSSGIIQFVASALAKNNFEKINNLIHTSILFLAALFVSFSVIVYGVVYFFINFIVQKQYAPVVLQILPYSLISLLLLTIAGVYTSVLEAFQKNYLKNIALIISAIVFVVVVKLYLDKYGLITVAYAQVIQSSIVLLLTIISCTSCFKSFSFFKPKWNKDVFKEIFSFGIKYQLISIASILFEPITKFLVGKFSNLTILGYYEMATRLVVQIRGVLVNANQVFVPISVNVNENFKEKSYNYFKTLFSTNAIITVIIMGLLLVGLPFISLIWIGNINETFVSMSVLLIIGYLFNLIMAPVYFAKIAQANLNLLIKAHVIMGLVNLFIGLLLGFFLKGYGPVFAWCIALVIAAVYMIKLYLQEIKISVKQIFTHSDKKLIAYLILLYSLLFIVALKVIVVSKLVSAIIWLSVAVIFTILLAIKFHNLPFIMLQKIKAKAK